MPPSPRRRSTRYLSATRAPSDTISDGYHDPASSGPSVTEGLVADRLGRVMLIRLIAHVGAGAPTSTTYTNVTADEVVAITVARAFANVRGEVASRNAGDAGAIRGTAAAAKARGYVANLSAKVARAPGLLAVRSAGATVANSRRI